MSKLRKGNKKNAAINGEWGAHVDKSMKKETSGIRRSVDKKEIFDEVKNLPDAPGFMDTEDVDDPFLPDDEDAKCPYNEDLN